MTTPGFRSSVGGAGTLLFTSLMLCFGVMVLAWAWVSLGWIAVDQFIGMLIAGVVVFALGLVAGVLQVVWFYVTWSRRNRRMRSYLMYVARTSRPGSLSGDPTPAVEGKGTSPVDAAGIATPALPDSSTTITNLDQYRRQP